MKLRRAPFLILASAMLISAMTPAVADTANPTREEQVAAFKAKYDPKFDKAFADYMVFKAKLSVDPSTKATFTSVIDDINEVRRTINGNLADSSAALQPIIEYAEEELGEFVITRYQLEKLAAKIKTISCVKGKATKKVSALSPKCPKGYTKK
jgi:hypothetical protein